MDYATQIGELRVKKEARNRGALGELMVKTKVNPEVAYSSDGISIELGTTVVSYASGRL